MYYYINEPIEIKINVSLNTWVQEADRIYWNISKLKYGDRVKLTFEGLDFIKPSGVVFLTILCKRIYHITGEKVIIENMRSDIYRYLCKINFFNLTGQFVIAGQLNRAPLLKSVGGYINRDSTIELMEATNFGQFSSLNNRIGDILDNWLPEERYQLYKDDIHTTLMELCNNSIEHSGASVYFMLQKYMNRWVEMCIGDDGIGISEHIRKKYNWIAKKDVDYIDIAMKGKSGRRDGDGGAGLNTIQKYVRQYNGELSIRSLKGKIKVDESGETTRMEYYYGFPGTQCHVIFRHATAWWLP